ncbi:class I SAM-dependent methyltransferase [Alterisphingorhabdus coralli]|uniref:Class I SAM-dependent methyltransferase n=1 Tax=Alterisphingorhabdus coralli TaxID=3071408 RepID=A0AA97FA89_9SPHN|nr:class I SAM-dependent methyltransferase [Parasphingorhabdus sp. SCSIO 66989]WOE75370.1 class I SAM-dependent methyltransferase [Parasphingorhabdus sp. SCSIO 66989]
MSKEQQLDVAPPYNAVAQHGVSPKPSHDEISRFDFLANFNKFLSGTLGAGNQLAYEKRVLPAFQKENGRDPKDRFEIRRAMNQDRYHQFWSALKRNSMEMRQQNGRSMVLRQLDELDAKARQYNEGRATLELNPEIDVPRYQSAVDIHCMPGSYHGEARPGDVSAGANYDCGLFATTAGGLGALSDGGGQALVEWIKKERPGWVPKRMLDIGCTVGHNIVPLALAFPDSEFIAIDTAAPILRYGHARAQSLGATNIRFIQANAEDMSRWPDGHFDWVQTTMFLHETSGKALPKIIAEGFRVLADGGLMLHLEQPEYTDEMPLFEQFLRDWDAFNNNEPFWSAMHALDMKDVMVEAGFGPGDLFETGVRAVVDREIFPEAPTGEDEDHGRAAFWHAYGAWKNVQSSQIAAE